MGLLAVPNVTAHPSTASVTITILLYNGLLLSSFNVPIKGKSGVQCCLQQLYATAHFHNGN